MDCEIEANDDVGYSCQGQGEAEDLSSQPVRIQWVYPVKADNKEKFKEGDGKTQDKCKCPSGCSNNNNGLDKNEGHSSHSFKGYYY